MKYLATVLSLISFFTFMACDGPVGPQGPRGFDGPEGVAGEPGEIGFVMEWENVDFTATNDYEVLLPYSDFSFEGFDSDAALVYFLWDVDNDGVEIWRQLPQTLITMDGLLQYNFDFSKFDVNLFLDADFSFDLLGTLDTDDWVVRVVVIPGEFVGGRKAASELSYQELAEELGLPDLTGRETQVIVSRRQ